MSPGVMKESPSVYIRLPFFKAGNRIPSDGLNLDLLPFQYPSFHSWLMGSRKQMTIKANPDWPQRRQVAESEQEVPTEGAGQSPAVEDFFLGLLSQIPK